MYTTVESDGTHTLTWDGRFWYAYESGCSARYDMPAGHLVNAEVCFERAGQDSEECQPVSFVHGEDDGVRVVVN